MRWDTPPSAAAAPSLHPPTDSTPIPSPSISGRPRRYIVTRPLARFAGCCFPCRSHHSWEIAGTTKMVARPPRLSRPRPPRFHRPAGVPRPPEPSSSRWAAAAEHWFLIDRWKQKAEAAKADDASAAGHTEDMTAGRNPTKTTGRNPNKPSMTVLVRRPPQKSVNRHLTQPLL